MPHAARVAVIMAGGSGERFWPLSTPDRPKQLLSLSNSGRTLLADAVERAQAIAAAENIFIATGPRIGRAVRDAELIDPDRVLIEPSPRNTLGAICWAVARLRAQGFSEDSTMAVLTADHSIPDVAAFAATANTAMGLAETTGGLVTIGIKPTRPETGYGYVQEGAPVQIGFTVRRFVEKPDELLAREYVESGDFLWNSGMFFWTIGAFLRELAEHQPDAALALEQLAIDEAAFARIPSTAIDRALLERSTRVYVVPAGFTWDDVGAWDALERLNERSGGGNVTVGGVVEVDSSGCIAYSDGIPIGLIGVNDLIVVATSNGVLVCPKSEAQRVREILVRMKDSGA